MSELSPKFKGIGGQAGDVGEVRVIKVAIPKRSTPITKCRECKFGRADQRMHIHSEELMPAYKGKSYRFLTKEALEKYKKPLMWAMKERWGSEKLDPFDCGGGQDTLFKDGKDEFAAVSLCRPRGFFRKLKNPGELLITQEKAREMLIQSVNDNWDFTPVA